MDEKFCKNCKYFRVYTAKLTQTAKNYDGFCSKRCKHKKLEDVCHGFENRD